MIIFSELQMGDNIRTDLDRTTSERDIVTLDREDKQACVLTEVQEFWYSAEHLHPIPLSDEWLRNLNFSKTENEDGSVKYSKDAFRILVHRKDDFNNFEIWYREDRRHMNHHLMVHELQNHFLQMTKVH